MKRIAIAVALASAMSGCATMQANMAANEARQAAARSEFTATKPVCSTEQTCAEGWAAARNWVINNCAMKIQNIADGYIETYGSVGGNPGLACRVTKDPVGEGKWMFSITTGCGNMFGCIPDLWVAANAFNKAVTWAMRPAVILD